MSKPGSPCGRAWRHEQARRTKGVQRPPSIAVNISGKTLERLAELMPAVASWASDEFGEAATNPADVVALAINVLHSQAFGPALERAMRERGQETAH